MKDVLIGKESLKNRKWAPLNLPCHLSFVPFTSGKDSSVHSWEGGFEEKRGGRETKSLLFHTCSQKAQCYQHIWKNTGSSFCTQKIHRDRFHLKIYIIHCVPEKIDSVLQLKNPASLKNQRAQGMDIVCNGNRSLNPLKINTWYKIHLKDKYYSSNILK